MEEDKKKKNIFIRILKKIKISHLLVLSILLAGNSYAWFVYISTVSNQIDVHVRSWRIDLQDGDEAVVNYVNDQDIVNNSDFSEVITPTFAGTTNIQSGVIAPTSTGSFNLEINGEDTDVSFTYTISLDTTDCNVSDLQITGYTIGNTHYNYTGNDITGDILLNDTNKVVSITFDVVWNDGTGSTMNNAADTAASKTGPATFDVDVNFIQKQ